MWTSERVKDIWQVEDIPRFLPGDYISYILRITPCSCTVLSWCFFLCRFPVSICFFFLPSYTCDMAISYFEPLRLLLQPARPVPPILQVVHRTRSLRPGRVLGACHRREVVEEEARTLLVDLPLRFLRIYVAGGLQVAPATEGIAIECKKKYFYFSGSLLPS